MTCLWQKMAIVALGGAALTMSSMTASAGGYVGNAYGVENSYQIFEFNEVGFAVRPISGRNLGGVAWPSAIRIGSDVHVFASVLTSAGWTEVHRWTSRNGAAYVDDGVVLRADSSEPAGIGPAAVAYDGSTFRLFYLVRGPSGPGSTVALASSADGLSFTRNGVVYQAGPEAPGGLSVSYVCQDGADHLLFLHGYSADIQTANSIVVTSPQVAGPYKFDGVTIAPTGIAGSATGQAGNNFVVSSAPLAEGHPIVIAPSPPGATSYVVEKMVGTVAYLDRPLTAEISNAPVADLARNKAELSFAEKMPDGSWRGALTGYGQFPGITSEYTIPIHASSAAGPWSFGRGYFLIPYFNSGKHSTENPEPIRSNFSCAAE